MRRTLYSRVAFIMFKNLLSQWRDCLLLKAVGVDKGLMCHVSKKRNYLNILFYFDHYHTSLPCIDISY